MWNMGIGRSMFPISSTSSIGGKMDLGHARNVGELLLIALIINMTAHTFCDSHKVRNHPSLELPQWKYGPNTSTGII